MKRTFVRLPSTAALLLAWLYLYSFPAPAQDATWTGANSAFWNVNTNWNPATVPTGTATFTGAAPNIAIFAAAPIGSLLFESGAPAYSFSNGGVFEINGTGIINNSVNPPSITNIAFGSPVLDFLNNSTAGDAIITTNNGGSTFFSGSSNGDRAMFITNSGGTVDISGLTTLGMTAGSIEGAGTYNLGSKALTVGLNNHSTTVSGPITGANAGGSGSLIKIGTGTLTLTGTSSYQNTIVDGGALTIQNGGKVSNVNGTLGAVAGTTGTISVIGPGSTWINSGGVGVGGSGTGTLNILNGGTVSDNNGTLGASPGSTGTVTVDGAGSIWANLSNLSVGSAGTGTMNITNGGLVTDAVGEIGQLKGSAGTVIVDGAHSTWTNSGGLRIGGLRLSPGGTGLLEITNGGTVNAAITTIWNTGILAVDASFTLNTALLTSNGGTIRTLADTTFPNSAILAGGVILDSNGFNSTFSGLFTGAGGLTKISPGTVILTADNTYAGGTIISEGTVQLGDGGTTGSIVGNVLDNGTLAFNRSGDKKTFDGVISGSGAVVKQGPDILELTQDNTYSGGTTIEDGVLVAGVPIPGQATSFALGTGDVFLNGGTLRTPSLDPVDHQCWWQLYPRSGRNAGRLVLGALMVPSTIMCRLAAMLA